MDLVLVSLLLKLNSYLRIGFCLGYRGVVKFFTKAFKLQSSKHFVMRQVLYKSLHCTKNEVFHQGFLQ